MEMKRPFFLFLVFFSCYLVFSLTFVSAYQTGDALAAGDAKSRHVKFIMEPVLKIVDDIRPIACDSSGYITFRAFVENIAEFDIIASEAFVEDISSGRSYNVASSVSCVPKTSLIGNQEITCRLNVRELLSKIPSCPFEKTGNKFYLSLDISYATTTAKVTASKDFVITGAGIKPEMEVKFDISQPPYPLPGINCRTGSEIDVPVVIHNAETLFGEIDWSFSVDKIASRMIECEKILSRTYEGRDDIYMCVLTVPDTIFRTCEDGTEVEVVINAEAGEHRLSGNFSTSLSSSELSLSMVLSGIPSLECQIIDEEGTCVPKEPQQNVTATISSNVIEKLKVFEARCRLGDDNVTTTLCRKLSSSRYECTVFVTLDRLPVPAKDGTSSKERDLTVFFDVKYLNYYRNISASTKVTLEGKLINGILNTTGVLNKKIRFLEWIQNSKLQKALTITIRTLNLINMCCIGVSFAQKAIEQATKRSFKEAFKKAIIEFLKEGLKKLLKQSIMGRAESAMGKIMNIIGNFGPKILGCIAREGIKDIEKENQNLQKFENKETISPDDLKIPTLGETIERHMAKCTAEAFWETFKDVIWGVLCAIAVIFVIVITWGGAAAPIKAVCDVATGALQYVGLVLNLLVMAITVLMMLQVFITATQAMALARERMNVQLNATSIMADYNEAFSQTIESMVTSMSVNAMLSELMSPYYATAKLLFKSERLGVLNESDNICSSDRITIEYNFDKLNQTTNFVSRLDITGPHSRTLLFDRLNGTYGPVITDELLGTNPNLDPSEDYTFTLRYENKRLDYTLHYMNHTC